MEPIKQNVENNLDSCLSKLRMGYLSTACKLNHLPEPQKHLEFFGGELKFGSSFNGNRIVLL